MSTKEDTMMKQSTPNNKKKNSIPKVLPAQIILEILSRLPIKTLFLCQLVSKHWLSLISNPHFVILHLSRSPVSLLLKPFYRNCGSNQLRLVDLQTLRKIRPREDQLKLNPKINFPLLGRQIVNSCNGLLCLCNDNSEIFVCNPILGDYITLPCPIYDRIYYDRTINAFNFTPKTKKYKVMQFILQRVVESFDPIIEFCTYRDEAKAKIYTIGDSPDFVVLILAASNFGPLSIDIWLMKDYGIKESWSKELVFDSALNLNIYGIKSEFYGIAHISSFVSLNDVAKGQSLMNL
ncbi:F-box protein At3g07870-like [Camellia sinensis]|uniref:F-box protein At3g07870-like n=1 Tax=Camellia sinensis TaxID=4442 RepID=UPI0010356D7C|nr:F-box protein At3g07870-like [Camellia sinensis]